MMLICEVYAAVTVSITALWIYTARTYSLGTLEWAMFFPGLFAPWFTEDPYFCYQILGIHEVWSSVLYCLVSVLCVCGVLCLTYIINRLTGWGYTGADTTITVKRTGGALAGFLRAAGEEIGWRCYLLPCLLTQYSSVQALLYSGVVWALYHVPVMVLLTGRFCVRDRWKTVLAQGTQCVLASFTFGYVAMCSGFSVWAPAVMHYAWNYLNPLLFGSIYTQEAGLAVRGEQWLINGEGLAGCVSWFPLALYVIYRVS